MRSAKVVLCAVLLLLGLSSAQGATSSYQGLWWASPANSESGWGVNFAHQGDVIFATWFTYDSNGRALWLSASLTETETNRFSGDLYRTTGPALGSTPFNPAQVALTRVGTASATFANVAAATSRPHRMRGGRRRRSMPWAPSSRTGSMWLALATWTSATGAPA